MAPEFEVAFFDDQAFNRSLSSNLIGFCRLLREQGMRITVTEQKDALNAVLLIGLQSWDQFYLSLRSTLAKSQEDQKTFDDHFSDFWHIWNTPKPKKLQPEPSDSEQTKKYPSPTAKGPQQTIAEWIQRKKPSLEETKVASYSTLQTMKKTDFSYLSGLSADEMHKVVEQIASLLAKQMSRRYRPMRQGQLLDFRRTIRKNLKHEFELLHLFYRKKQTKKLKLIVLCDVSQSMDIYSRFLITFLYSFQQLFRKIETFAFSTELQYLSPLLANKNVDSMLSQLSRTVPSWSGGTKIGDCLNTFLDDFGDWVNQKTVILIMSDGWDTGNLELLDDCMASLKQKSKWLIWINPLKGYKDYSPESKGMKIALPYLDYFGSAHSIESLEHLAQFLKRSLNSSP